MITEPEQASFHEPLQTLPIDKEQLLRPFLCFSGQLKDNSIG
jgi:hypothetical protein